MFLLELGQLFKNLKVKKSFISEFLLKNKKIALTIEKKIKD